MSGLEFIRFDLDLVSVLPASLCSGSRYGGRGRPGCDRSHCLLQVVPSCWPTAENVKVPLLGKALGWGLWRSSSGIYSYCSAQFRRGTRQLQGSVVGVEELSSASVAQNAGVPPGEHKATGKPLESQWSHWVSSERQKQALRGRSRTVPSFQLLITVW